MKTFVFMHHEIITCKDSLEHTMALNLVTFLVAPIYLTMAVCAYTTFFSTTLESFSLHGKLRIDHDARIESRFWKKIDLALVPKRWFFHFYIFGLASAFSILSYQISTIIYDPSFQFVTWPVPKLLLWGSLISHLTRRLYECFRVHQWNDARMNIAGYAVGLIHYILLPLCFMDCTNFDEDWFIRQNGYMNLVFAVLGFSVCLWGQFEQHIHHKLLANLRTRKMSKFLHESKISQNCVTEKFSLPEGRWFNYVSCPHYLAEIMIYVGLIIISNCFQCRLSCHPSEAESRLLVSMDWQIANCVSYAQICTIMYWITTGIKELAYFKRASLMLWVVTNLSISASRSHDLYKREFAKKIPVDRMALFPFLW